MCNKKLDGAQHAEKERSWSKDAFSTIWNFKLDISSSKFMAQEEKENTTKEKKYKKKKIQKRHCLQYEGVNLHIQFLRDGINVLPLHAKIPLQEVVYPN